MKKFLTIAAMSELIFTTACEQDSIDIVHNLDVWATDAPCIKLEGTTDFVGQLDFYPHPQTSVIHIHDYSFPDFGVSQYFAIVQYKDANGLTQCVGINENAPYRFSIPAAFLNEARIIFKRVTLDDNGEVFMEADSPFYFFTNNTFMP